MNISFNSAFRENRKGKGRCAFCLLLDDWLCEKCWTKFQPDDNTGYCAERDLRDLVK